MLMLGFLVSIWLAMRRAMRVKADPDLILNIGFVSLICGVGGARIFFVAHYWKTDFAWQPNPLWAAINISAGGLEYYGGLLAAIAGVAVYLRFFARFRAQGDSLDERARRRPSLRLYLDILAPSVMLGLAFGRMGCFLNGCCWGGVCTHAEHGQQVAALPWAVTFPFGSGAQHRQWENRELRVPAELIYDDPNNVNAPYLIFDGSLAAADKLDPLVNRWRALEREQVRARSPAPDLDGMAELERQIDVVKREVQQAQHEHFTVLAATAYPSREDPSKWMTPSELRTLAAQYPSLPVHPAQLYGLINAVLLSVLLSRLFYRRRRHGVVFGLMLVLYPITRVVLELVRVDNPHDTTGLTISQAVSVGMFAFGLIYLALLVAWLPVRSARAVACAPYLPEKKKR